jgi:cell division protein ZapE
MRLIDSYNEAVACAEIKNDPAQREIIESLQRVADELTTTKLSWWNCWYKKPVKGLYLYGSVGVGKTYLGDLFYQHVAEQQKARFHFHQFMQQIDAQLRSLQGKSDPLRRIVARLAKTTRLLCLDEFMVHDVADAMMLSELLKALFAHHVVLVVTSNIAPDDLYSKGVQRARFLPAITLLKRHCDVIAMADHADYRLGRPLLQQAYFWPLNPITEEKLAQHYSALAIDSVEGVVLDVQNRLIPSVRCSKHAVWFQFDVICNLPRSSLDYLEIADRFDVVFLTDIPALTVNDTVKVILLIHFIDVMYDRGIQLVISAAVAVHELYLQGELFHRFQRTLSRLEEMQSEDYARRHHRRSVRLLPI